MRPLRQFKEFVQDGKVKRQSPDRQRAFALKAESQEKNSLFEKVMAAFGVQGVTPNFIIENCYDILLELVRARLFVDGFNSDSHEAEVAYLRLLAFSETDVSFMNELRYYRNGIKYYGKRLEGEYAAKVLAFFKEKHESFERLVGETG